MGTIALKGNDGNKISTTYKNLWIAFQNTAKRFIFHSIPKEFKPNFIETDGRILILKTNYQPLILSGWPWKISEKGVKERLAISIEMEQTIYGESTTIGTEYKVEKSVIYVNYYETEKIIKDKGQLCGLRVLLSARYEADPSLPNHPLFHAHTTEFEQLKIATPPMDLKAVLYGLIADHADEKLNDLNTNRLWKRTKEALPIMPCYIIRDRIGISSGRMLSEHWYNIK